MAAFDKLWMCLYTKLGNYRLLRGSGGKIIIFFFSSLHLGELCIDERPAVRKSAGQTLFSTIAAHGDLLHHNTWQAVVWQVKYINW